MFHFFYKSKGFAPNMLHSTTHMSLSLSLFSCFSSMGALPANSREENSPQEQQQRSNANHTYRPNLNVLLPQPRLPINRYIIYIYILFFFI
ncbi:hypothetical protein Gohar_002147 [Gossypium harknessii]|uniref:Uncharacterized protein n=1 Tax=Gossypium harknessii TaxID=34285 RepID=A0A7J9HJX5_9ROSI|nr:hypothetical protein [Gossypium harknessii]